MIPESSTGNCKVGCRIEYGRHFGTVKYVGPIEGYPGMWLGIDWDDIERGKHNGTVNGVYYFDTRHPKSGSFLKVKEGINFGQSLINAIRTRYGQRDNELAAKFVEQELLVFQQSIRAPFLECVGFDKVIGKQSDFSSLEVVNVRLQSVSSIGTPNELCGLCPNIRDIDVSKNLLSCWSDIFLMCSQLEHLFVLNVSENILFFPENCEDYVFPNITVLICGYMMLTWSDVIKLSSIFPKVKELRVPYNNITNLMVPVQHHLICLKVLDLEGNAIRHWTEVNKLSLLLTLEHLILENTKLEDIRFDATFIPSSHFPSLTKLNITANLINEWRSLAELNKLQKLEYLRCVRNPVLEPEKWDTSRQLIIAKLEHLKVLNGTTITSDERRGAEYDYVKKYALEWLRVKDTSEQEYFLLEHSRYLELIAKHGFPEESEIVVQPNILKSSLIALNFEYERKIILKKLPPSITIQKLITLVQKLFQLTERPTLTYVSGSKSDIVIQLDNEMKELAYYSIRNGDTITVEI
ncbi:hypothetical protein NQ315_001378 [Exocentrus adspersus]|uniref:Tubulin-specific chaperone E n=1 Tax=Exocentrus adspersus TaxID=1586481 RepID=A0AAV8WG32_9CUCU|nr:hypothetical protein NQ315_001378 [Exocentrus adspersus]